MLLTVHLCLAAFGIERRPLLAGVEQAYLDVDTYHVVFGMLLAI